MKILIKRLTAGLLVAFLIFAQVETIPDVSVQGGSNLTTVGAIPYVSASGVLSQDANIYRGTNNDGSRAIVVKSGSAPDQYPSFVVANSSGTTVGQFQHDGANGITVYGLSNMAFNLSATRRATISSTAFGIGPSNTSPTGTLHVYDATATTGVTTLTVRAGAGQASANLQEWKNAAGTTLSRITNAGGLVIDEVENSVGNFSFGNNVLRVGSGFVFRFSGTAAFGGTPDLGLARDAAGRLKVTDGSTGLGSIMIAGSTPASASATCAAGTITWDASYFYTCVATDTWRRVAHATW